MIDIIDISPQGRAESAHVNKARLMILWQTAQRGCHQNCRTRYHLSSSQKLHRILDQKFFTEFWR